MSKVQEALSYIIDNYIDIDYCIDIDCQAKSMNKDTEVALQLQGLIDNQFTQDELDYINLKTLGWNQSNKHCLEWEQTKVEDIEENIASKITMQKGMIEDNEL